MGTAMKGISILIPIYNFDVRILVQMLSAQLETSKIDYEIICIDDFSSPSFSHLNRELISWKNISYIELSKNCGRSGIRNMLAEKAKYSYLLFLDCDTGIDNSNFVSNYLNYSSYQVVIGGRKYAPPLPEKDFILHWKVGKAREERLANLRNLNPYGNFMFNNIFIHKETYLQICLDENITTYGHEDTKFGEILAEKKIEVMHIDNPTLHIGLDKTDFFLQKTAAGVRNLYALSKDGYGHNAALYKTFLKLKRTGMVTAYTTIFGVFYKLALKNLKSSHPSLFVFDLYKLYFLCKEAKQYH